MSLKSCAFCPSADGGVFRQEVFDSPEDAIVPPSLPSLRDRVLRLHDLFATGDFDFREDTVLPGDFDFGMSFSARGADPLRLLPLVRLCFPSGDPRSP